MNYSEAKLLVKKIDSDTKKNRCIFLYKCYDYENGSENIVQFLFRILKKGIGLSYDWKENSLIRDDKDVCEIRIIIHAPSDLLTGYPTGVKRDNSSRDVNFFGQAEDCKTPTLHIALNDLYVESLYNGAPLPASIPRSFQIMDNSIWNYLVPLSGIVYRNSKGENVEEKAFCQLFEDAIDSIYKTFKRHIYTLKVAQEYVDLNSRLVGEAFLLGSHAKGVSPFVFHSESAIKKMIIEEFENNSNNIINKIRNRKWRILLVDDKAVLKMQPKDLFPDESSSTNLPWNCKLRIVEDLLKKKFGDCVSHQDNSQTKLLIEYAQTLNDAEEALKQKKYDIILLDYLLDKGNGKQNYGYELLDNIFRQIDNANEGEEIDYDAIEYKIGPRERLFFMFISAYSSAVYERLLAEGLNQSEDYWYISVGACPTNTPQLFLYNLIKLMEKRMEDSGILKLSSKAIFERVNKIYSPRGRDSKGESVRKRANAYYQKVLSLQYHYRNILKDVEIPFGNKSSIFDTKGSVLMTDFIQNRINLGGMLEHLTQLVHLTAFGTIRQWPEMWEEYIYVKTLFEKQVEADNEVDEIDCKTLFSNIENYILDLKSQQR